MPRKKETLTLSIPAGVKARLDRLAEQLGYHWGKRPSPSALITAIAQGELALRTGKVLTDPHVRALQRAVKDLVDAGHIDDAKSVITLLLENAELTPPLRQDLLRQISQPIEGWRLQIEDCIRNSQPFHLIYCKPNQEPVEFTVRYAELTPYEKRLYLQIWCEEVEDSRDIPALAHNRTLRLDRIQGLVPISGHWQRHLEHILVEIHFLNDLIYAYEPRLEDVENQVRDNIRRVVRRVYNTFWFFREIRRYGADCIVVGPPEVRDRFARDAIVVANHYR